MLSTWKYPLLYCRPTAEKSDFVLCTVIGLLGDLIFNKEKIICSIWPVLNNNSIYAWSNEYFTIIKIWNYWGKHEKWVPSPLEGGLSFDLQITPILVEDQKDGREKSSMLYSWKTCTDSSSKTHLFPFVEVIYSVWSNERAKKKSHKGLAVFFECLPIPFQIFRVLAGNDWKTLVAIETNQGPNANNSINIDHLQ